MFVPSSPGGKLSRKLEELETKLYEEGAFDWNVKLLEKSGSPLKFQFLKYSQEIFMNIVMIGT